MPHMPLEVEDLGWVNEGWCSLGTGKVTNFPGPSYIYNHILYKIWAGDHFKVVFDFEDCMVYQKEDSNEVETLECLLYIPPVPISHYTWFSASALLYINTISIIIGNHPSIDKNENRSNHFSYIECQATSRTLQNHWNLKNSPMRLLPGCSNSQDPPIAVTKAKSRTHLR